MAPGRIAARRQEALEKLATLLELDTTPFTKTKWSRELRDLFLVEAVVERIEQLQKVAVPEGLEERLTEIQGVGPAKAKQIIAIMQGRQ